MKKKILALLLGAIMAVGGGSLAVPAVAQAEYVGCMDPGKHFSSWTLTPEDGQITIQWVSDVPNLCAEAAETAKKNSLYFYIAEEKVEGAESKRPSELSGEAFVSMVCASGSGSRRQLYDHGTGKRYDLLCICESQNSE